MEASAAMRGRNSSGSRNQYSRPSSSPGRRSRVVADTVTSRSGTRSSSSRISVPLPAPDGPVTTMTEGRQLPVEELNQLRTLPVGQAADRLRLADAAGVQEARSLDASELRHRHQDVDHLRRLDVLGRPPEDRLDPDPPVLQVLLELGPLDAYVVRPPERVHALIEGTNGCVSGCGSGHGQAPDTTNVPAAIKRRLLRGTPATFRRGARRPSPRRCRRRRALRESATARPAR